MRFIVTVVMSLLIGILAVDAQTSQPSTSSAYVVNADNAEFFFHQNGTPTGIGKLPIGTEITVDSISGGRHYFSYSGKPAYIDRQFVTSKADVIAEQDRARIRADEARKQEEARQRAIEQQRSASRQQAKQEEVAAQRRAVQQAREVAQQEISVHSAQPEATAPTGSATKPSITNKTPQEEGNDAVTMGLMYGTGNGVKTDVVEAVRWFRKAAEVGNSEGKYQLGVAYVFGLGVEKNEREAVKWFQKAAEDGHPAASYNLGVCYAKGIGVKKDEKEAVKCYRKAIGLGNAGAMLNLGVMYWEGRDVEIDRAEATRLFQMAAELGNSDAKQNLAKAREYARHQQEQVQPAERQEDRPSVQDAGAVAVRFIKNQIASGVLRSANLVGYQHGLGAECVAIYNCDYISQGGMHMTRMYSVSMSRDGQGNWEILAFEPGGVFEGLPLESDWQRATGGGQTPLNRVIRQQRGY